MDYKELPERVDAGVLKFYFRELLARIRDSRIVEMDALVQIKELTVRQWYTFELLDLAVRTEIDQWLIEVWHPISEQKVDIITFIVANLGLIHTYEYLLIVCTQLNSDKYKRIIYEMIDELDGNVEDPYQEMHKYITI